VVITRSANMCSGTNSLQESSVVGRNMRMESSKGLASANRSNAAGPGAVAGSVKRNNSLNEANRRIKSPCFVPGEDSLSKDEQARIRVARTSRGFLTGTETQGRRQLDSSLTNAGSGRNPKEIPETGHPQELSTWHSGEARAAPPPDPIEQGLQVLFRKVLKVAGVEMLEPS
jgi:hypothetical protein